MTAKIVFWRNKPKTVLLDKPVLQVDVNVHYGITKVTLVLSGQEIDYELHQGDVMAIRTNTSP